jgi:hypothetical protein
MGQYPSALVPQSPYDPQAFRLFDMFSTARWALRVLP